MRISRPRRSDAGKMRAAPRRRSCSSAASACSRTRSSAARAGLAQPGGARAELARVERRERVAAELAEQQREDVCRCLRRLRVGLARERAADDGEEVDGPRVEGEAQRGGDLRERGGDDARTSGWPSEAPRRSAPISAPACGGSALPRRRATWQHACAAFIRASEGALPSATRATPGAAPHHRQPRLRRRRQRVDRCLILVRIVALGRVVEQGQQRIETREDARRAAEDQLAQPTRPLARIGTSGDASSCSASCKAASSAAAGDGVASSADASAAGARPSRVRTPMSSVRARAAAAPSGASAAHCSTAAAARRDLRAAATTRPRRHQKRRATPRARASGWAQAALTRRRRRRRRLRRAGA